MCYPSRETSVDYFLQEIVDLLHSNDRGAVRTESDHDWLEINGNSTIPHVQSIRAPPAPIALPATKENMLGITNKNMSRRYLEKLQKDRERNQEVLAECIDNLPITIKQLVYPEKPHTKDPARNSNISSNVTRETKFRVGRSNDYWQESAGQWVKEESNSQDTEQGPSIKPRRNNNGRIVRRESSHHSKSSTNSGGFLNKDFVHYPGFQGSSGQGQSLKYKYGKKSSVGSDGSNKQAAPIKFKPKGYGSLYDEMEFERRYKKVFDLNKHIHFVHSNFLSGQRLMKKTKLPPIGPNPSVQSDPMDSGDIFAIMSVQKYNHPQDYEKSRQALSNPDSGLRRSDGMLERRPNRPKLEVSQSLDTPIGFVPGTIPNTGSSPFDGINGTPRNEITRESLYRLHSFLREEKKRHSTSRTESEKQAESPRRGNGMSKTEELTGFQKTPSRTVLKPASVRSRDIGSEIPDDLPFNITVHVEIRPTKEHTSGDNIEELPALGDASPDKMVASDNHPELPSPRGETNDDIYATNRANTEHKERNETFKERDMYPTRINSFGIHANVDVENNLDTPETTIKPTHISVTTNEYGIVSRKVQYPEDFVIDKSVTAGDEIERENNVIGDNAIRSNSEHVEMDDENYMVHE